MGKVKRKKNKQQRSNPIGNGHSSTAVEDQVHENGAGSTDVDPFVETLIEQLRSRSAEERDSGLNTISSSCTNPSLLDQFLKHDVVKIACTLLADKSPMVRHSAAGALRNMSTVGSAVCSLMISQGILPPLVTLFKENFAAEWKPQLKSNLVNGFRIDTVLETFVEAVNLLWNLCESSGTALKIFNDEELAQILIRCLNTKEYGIRASLAAAQCLNTTTEDNKDAIPNIGEFETLLQQILVSENDSSDSSHPNKNDWVYLQTLASGILLNLGGSVSKLSTANISLTMKTISEMLSFDHIEKLNSFSSEIPLRSINAMETNQEGEVAASTTNETSVEKIHSLEISTSNISNLLNGQMLALEVLSNILFLDAEDEGDDFDTQSASEEDDMTEEESMQEDEAMDNESWASIVPEVYEAITQLGLMDSVLSKIRELPINVTQILKESPEYGRNIEKSLRNLRCRALLCFQNLIDGLSLNDLGGFSKMKVIWSSLNQLLKQEAIDDFDDENELVEAITSAMRAITFKWTDDTDKGHVIDGVSAADFNVLCGVYSKVKIAKIHTNIIKIIGGMGILLARKSTGSMPTEEIELLLQQVGSFLLNCITSYGDSQHLWRVSEALDTIFDVFAEDDFNHVIKKLDMIEKLKVFQPQFKKSIRNARRNLGENKAIIETSRTNLSRFIDYKIKNGCA